jgi:hypothetical protein
MTVNDRYINETIAGCQGEIEMCIAKSKNDALVKTVRFMRSWLYKGIEADDWFEIARQSVYFASPLEAIYYKEAVAAMERFCKKNPSGQLV